MPENPPPPPPAHQPERKSTIRISCARVEQPMAVGGSYVDGPVLPLLDDDDPRLGVPFPPLLLPLAPPDPRSGPLSSKPPPSFREEQEMTKPSARIERACVLIDRTVPRARETWRPTRVPSMRASRALTLELFRARVVVR